MISPLLREASLWSGGLSVLSLTTSPRERLGDYYGESSSLKGQLSRPSSKAQATVLWNSGQWGFRPHPNWGSLATDGPWGKGSEFTVAHSLWSNGRLRSLRASLDVNTLWAHCFWSWRAGLASERTPSSETGPEFSSLHPRWVTPSLL